MLYDKHLLTNGIVIRESDYKENSKLLTIFTEDEGKVNAVANGVKKKDCSYKLSACLFSYSGFDLYKGKSTLYTLTDASLIQAFYGIRNDIDVFMAAENMNKTVYSVVQEGLPDLETLRLYLVALYKLSTNASSDRTEIVKSAFYIKLAEIQGVLKDTVTIAQGYGFSLKPGTVNAIEYITSSDIDATFSFVASNEVRNQLVRISEDIKNDLLYGN